VTQDFNAIRELYFQNLASIYRQNLVYTDYCFPQLNMLRQRFFHNFEGGLQSRPWYAPLCPTPSSGSGGCSQEFLKLEPPNLAAEPEERFRAF